MSSLGDSDGVPAEPVSSHENVGISIERTVGSSLHRGHAKDGGLGQVIPLTPVRSARSEQQAGPEFAAWEYKPHASGDPVDAAVASLVNRPGRYRGWRALLCRLDQGVYLCGTRRVHLRADLVQQKIEASDDNGATWSDLESLMRGAEASQRALLERARDGAGLTS